MTETEAKRRLKEHQKLAFEGFRREIAENKLKKMEDALQEFKEEIAKQTPKLNEGLKKESKPDKLPQSTESVIKDFEKTLHEYMYARKMKPMEQIQHSKYKPADGSWQC